MRFTKLAVLASLFTLSTQSFAVVDVAPVVTEIGLYPAVIGAVGAAVLIVALAVKGIKWARAAL